MPSAGIRALFTVGLAMIAGAALGAVAVEGLHAQAKLRSKKRRQEERRHVLGRKRMRGVFPWRHEPLSISCAALQDHSHSLELISDNREPTFFRRLPK
jgi:hypothetical protein